MEYVSYIVTAGLGLALYYFKRDSETLYRKSNKLNDDIQSVHNDLQSYKQEAQKEFVSKDEFIRTTSSMDKKLDKIYDEILKIKKDKE